MLLCNMELWMHLGSFLSTQEARVALGYRLVQYSYASFVLSNLQRASISLNYIHVTLFLYVVKHSNMHNG